ncbi:HNH endonuclease [Thermogemmatispora sp.]|uniref:HNH endonuclease n=1 Tax=Thermogemmatispora sp. TaxID=1968838 RepID=UPI0035E41483
MGMDRQRYPPNWAEISRAARERAGWRCQWCGAAQGEERVSLAGKRYQVVLTVAHLGTPFPDGRPADKRDKQDCRPENLAALCQRCHLRYDIDEHVGHARQTRWRKHREAQLQAGQLLLFE